MNVSTVLRLMEAANDDAALAAWAAVFDRHQMPATSDVSPYDCWEVLQDFLTAGVLTPAQYNGVDTRTAFFSRAKPSAGQIQDVLDRLYQLRVHQPLTQETPMSKAVLPFSAFNESVTVKDDQRAGRSLDTRPTRASLPGSPFNALQASPQPTFTAPAMRAALQDPPRAAPAPKLPCRNLDASLYQGVGQQNIELLCCNQAMILMVHDENLLTSEEYGGEDDAPGMIHDAMFEARCESCSAIFNLTMSRRVPDDFSPYPG